MLSLTDGGLCYAPTAMSGTTNPTLQTQIASGISRFSTRQLLAALVLLLASAPFIEDLQYGVLIDGVLLSVVLLSAVLAVGGRRGKLIIATVLVSPALVARWISHLSPSPSSRLIAASAGMVFVAFVVVQLLLYVLRVRRVDSEVLCGAISAYLLLAILFATAYALVAVLIPGSFAWTAPAPSRPMAGFDALYFSFVTLSTVGYGDIVPVSNAARMLAMAEATGGMFYITVLMARLVSVYSRDPANGNV